MVLAVVAGFVMIVAYWLDVQDRPDLSPRARMGWSAAVLVFPVSIPVVCPRSAGPAGRRSSRSAALRPRAGAAPVPASSSSASWAEAAPLSCADMSDTSPEAQRALAYLREHADEHLRGLDEFLRMESVSADPTQERGNGADRAVDRGRVHGHRFRARAARPRRAATRWSPPTGSTPALTSPPCWSTATTTSSRLIRWRSGSGRRSSRGTKTTSCTPVAAGTTRASSTCTSAPPRRG